MGLDTTHDAWHGAYGAFMRWRQKIASVAGIPPLNLMEAFFQKGDVYDPFVELAKKWPETAAQFYESLPIPWASLKPDVLHILLHHSDCDGEIRWQDCGKIADRLEELLPKLPDTPVGGHIGDYKHKTLDFIKGLRKAHEAKENLGFH